jgi:hypothetical protein
MRRIKATIKLSYKSNRVSQTCHRKAVFHFALFRKTVGDYDALQMTFPDAGQQFLGVYIVNN